MPRGKRTVIETRIEDDVVERLSSLSLEEVKENMEKKEENISKVIEEIYKKSQKGMGGEREELFPIKEAYDYVISRGMHISFRAFGGRIERGNIPCVKIGRRRYIPKRVLDELLETNERFYTVREAFEEYKKHNPKINFRAFIGRVEKGSIPSVKWGTRRLIPAEAIEALTRISSKYFSVSEALEELRRRGVRIKRNAFERRLDRGRIPHVKIGGRRYIHEEVLNELIEKELQNR